MGLMTDPKFITLLLLAFLVCALGLRADRNLSKTTKRKTKHFDNHGHE